MTALDDAERLLVSGSFERAKGEAAAARKDARSTSERVAAECVWIQAEYKLGGLTRHDLDAARMVTGFGEEFHRASVLLWSRLRLADPTDPAEAEGAPERDERFAAVAPGANHASLLGRTVQVFWPSEETWHAGRVLRFDPGSGGASVLYATGDVEQGVVVDALAEKGHLFVL